MRYIFLFILFCFLLAGGLWGYNMWQESTQLVPLSQDETEVPMSKASSSSPVSVSSQSSSISSSLVSSSVSSDRSLSSGKELTPEEREFLSGTDAWMRQLRMINVIIRKLEAYMRGVPVDIDPANVDLYAEHKKFQELADAVTIPPDYPEARSVFQDAVTVIHNVFDELSDPPTQSELSKAIEGLRTIDIINNRLNTLINEIKFREAR